MSPGASVEFAIDQIHLVSGIVYFVFCLKLKLSYQYFLSSRRFAEHEIPDTKHLTIIFALQAEHLNVTYFNFSKISLAIYRRIL